MARIINFYVPPPHRRIIRKQAGSVGLTKVIPFPSATGRHSGTGRHSRPSLPARTERFGMSAFLRNNGILSLIAGV
jgi:hypothetical protein